MNNQELGKRIKQLRLSQGFTLKDIESKVGVSATHVSEIERGKTSPTVGALAKIATALQVNPSFLVDIPVGDDVSHTKTGDRFRLMGARNGAQWEVLTGERPSAELSLFMLDLPRDMGEPLDQEPRTGDKFLHVIEGTLEVQIGEDRNVLERGDSIHFKASREAKLQSVGESPCRVFVAAWPRFTV